MSNAPKNRRQNLPVRGGDRKPARVRPYSLPGGRTRFGHVLLVETFVAQVAAAGEAWIGHGQCIEQYGTGEAYLPVLEALGRLCRGPEGPHVLTWLRQHAPSWLAQIM